MTYLPIEQLDAAVFGESVTRLFCLRDDNADTVLLYEITLECDHSFTWTQLTFFSGDFNPTSFYLIQ